MLTAVMSRRLAPKRRGWLRNAEARALEASGRRSNRGCYGAASIRCIYVYIYIYMINHNNNNHNNTNTTNNNSNNNNINIV